MRFYEKEEITTGQPKSERAFLKIIIFYLFVYLFLAMLGLHCCAGFSLAVTRESYSSRGPRASHYSGSSCCGVQAAGMWASGAVAMGSVVWTPGL